MADEKLATVMSRLLFRVRDASTQFSALETLLQNREDFTESRVDTVVDRLDALLGPLDEEIAGMDTVFDAPLTP